MKFETAMVGVKKVVQGTPEQINQLGNEIQEMSIQLGMGSDAVAEIAAQGGGLGIPIEQLGEFTEMAGKMAIAFDMTAEQAGDAAAKLSNVFGIPITQVGQLGDAINVLGNTTAAKESEIVDAMQRIGGNAKQFGLAGEQAAALAASMISLGKTPEVAATAINALLTKLQTANVQSDDFKNTLSNIGISANQMAADINANPQQALSNFLQTLSTMDSQQRSVATFKLFGQDYVDDVNALVGGLDGYNKALNSVKDKTSTAGAMQKEFEAKMATSEQAIGRAKQTLSVLAQSIGKELLPVVALGANAIGGMAKAVGDFSASHPLLTKAAVLIAGANVAMIALNSTMTLAGGLGLTSFGRVATSATTATTAITATTAATTRLNAVMGGMAGAAGGIAGVAANLNKVSVGSDMAAGNVAKLATQAMALTMAFDAGKGIGDWLYNNSELARGFGDRLAAIPAIIHSIVTTGGIQQFLDNFQIGKSHVKELGDETKKTAKTQEELAAEQNKAASAAKEQASANIQLANEIKTTTANLEGMKNRLAEMEAGGQKNTTAYSDLSAEIGKTSDKLTLLQAEANKKGIGELLKTDLDKASASFQALGLDAQEFATGIDSKTNAALSAFVDIAHLAEGDTRKLALAYNAAKSAAGDNSQAQAELDAKLNQVTQGNKQLADSVKATALEQKNAKSASEEQANALDKLGISMTAANNGMSKGGAEMVATLKSGITAIMEQATSADALKTSLQQAFAQSIGAAQTKADFAAVKQAIEAAGVASQLTAEQLKILDSGMAGGAESAKKTAEAIEAQAKSHIDNANASNQTAEAGKKVAQSNKEIGDSAAEAAEKSKQSADEQVEANAKAAGSIQAWMEQVENATKRSYMALSDIGVGADQANAAFTRLKENAFFEGEKWADFNVWAADMAELQKVVDRQATSFRQAHDNALQYTQALGGADVSVNNLADAEGALRQAQQANIDGIIKMDNATLTNLQNAIDATRKKFADMAEQAKDAADSLEANLARMKGDDGTAQRIEQTKKLADLQEKLNEAQKRGNSDEVAQLQRAIELQKQINAEETRQTENKKQQADEQKRQNAEKQAQQQQPKTTPAPTPSPKPTPAPMSQPSANDSEPSVAASAKEVAYEISKIKKEAIDEFMKVLKDELKRLPK